MTSHLTTTAFGVGTALDLVALPATARVRPLALPLRSGIPQNAVSALAELIDFPFDRVTDDY